MAMLSVEKLPVDFNISTTYSAEKLIDYLASESPLEFERAAKQCKIEVEIHANIKKTHKIRLKVNYDKKYCSISRLVARDMVLEKTLYEQTKGRKLEIDGWNLI